MLDWVKFIVKEHKAILSLVLLLLGISGVSIYGNINEFNPWKVAQAPETVVESKPEITQEVLTEFTAIIVRDHIEEYH